MRTKNAPDLTARSGLAGDVSILWRMLPHRDPHSPDPHHGRSIHVKCRDRRSSDGGQTNDLCPAIAPGKAAIAEPLEDKPLKHRRHLNAHDPAASTLERGTGTGAVFRKRSRPGSTLPPTRPRFRERTGLLRLDFRGSIAWLGGSLSTLRRFGCPTRRKTRLRLLAKLCRAGFAPAEF